MMKEHKKLERLMLFSEVAEHLSFTAAAEKLNVSRGHLSSQIKRLEQDMEMVLLIRSTRSVRLTPEGERVLTGMNKIRHDLLELERSAEHEGNKIEGRIKITAPGGFAERFLFDIFSQFKQLHPAIEFSLNCSYTRFDLNRSDFDFAFRATSEPPQNMVAKHLMSYQHCCCASPKYFDSKGVPKTPADLINHECLKGQEQTTWQFQQEAVQTQGWLEVNDNNMLKGLALADKGIIRVPKYLVDKEVKSGKLKTIFEEKMPSGSMIYIIHPQRIHPSKRISTFLNFTQQYFAK
ncbi:LysR family transcriptional regulator [Colwellia psychrerythraea]|uniref:Substrate-binding transcriptional regulator, LysR family n=1 Tax=Colwellia psychrerythraea (strain 34H / ATCC BAA-681) TaxID=167879 RepID=Q47UG3_COLP3|nr:LysR family transcriptional regulator [Colwellia psychrerythraea]AAZ24435.1 substrate-binding transcriptional regulator, LysR family [Colwellia psychrerythraea 34H]